LKTSSNTLILTSELVFVRNFLWSYWHKLMQKCLSMM